MMRPCEAAAKIIAEHCAEMPEEKRAALQAAIMEAMVEWGDERYSDGYNEPEVT